MKTLKFYRKKQGMSRKAFADKFGISPFKLFLYEIGIVKPDTELLYRIADFLHVPVEWLIEK